MNQLTYNQQSAEGNVIPVNVQRSKCNHIQNEDEITFRKSGSCSQFKCYVENKETPENQTYKPQVKFKA